MNRRRISSGSRFEQQMAYSRAVVAGDWVFVSGTTGFDYQTMTIDGDVAAQAEQCFKNIDNALQQAGSRMADLVRVTYVLPEASDFEACWPVMQRWLGDVRPAATMLSARLVDERIKIEIEVTALKRPGTAP